MILTKNPAYQALAASAAAELGNSSPAIVRAILAQWQCEIGNASYPPPRNNPGNMARGAAQGIGAPFTVAPGPNPQPGNPIVTFPSAAAGAHAYAAGIRAYARYALARSAIARGDGQGFLVAVTNAGYGTNQSCCLRVYASETGAIPLPHGAPHHAARVTVPTAIWNDGTHRWVYNGPNAIKPGTCLTVRGAHYQKGGQDTWPIVGGTPFGGYYVPVAHVELTS
ncbi:MAG: hypothetical protein ACRDGQ_09675 [Candidatus Limnocylindrales bacterium]